MFRKPHDYGEVGVRLFKDLVDEMEVLSEAEMMQDQLDSIPVEEQDRLSPAAAIRRHLVWDHIVHLS